MPNAGEPLGDVATKLLVENETVRVSARQDGDGDQREILIELKLPGREPPTLAMASVPGLDYGEAGRIR
jgi:hypothetical protein